MVDPSLCSRQTLSPAQAPSLQRCRASWSKPVGWRLATRSSRHPGPWEAAPALHTRTARLVLRHVPLRHPQDLPRESPGCGHAGCTLFLGSIRGLPLSPGSQRPALSPTHGRLSLRLLNTSIKAKDEDFRGEGGGWRTHQHQHVGSTPKARCTEQDHIHSLCWALRACHPRHGPGEWVLRSRFTEQGRSSLQGRGVPRNTDPFLLGTLDPV